ncbi:MAG: hypothetical protein A2X34_01765 [Elusimicrobia bacterium GWC2_51_8]|nr:MAG: hypothetical protein A2X33_11540 [Elusimicrobia bacterium GWA2_51_34]OGR66168.1 MAG: hypothetical protein A2X34_01765 [Elusimicrobia bacterium GWC2_51_8]OGR85971.1 MAG: hypothetical protein A2021_03530 [Elusimicrobia bacterium GWF2_52_66]HAF96644.1 hypothetical protein [Elusimicrobiota bacterium]HCE97305.1 hypothetical protein [Elusimicrobiota bacterium]
MRIINLKPVAITPIVIRRLEKLGLVRAFRPTTRSLRVKEGGCVVDKVYATAPRFGTHKLVCVGKNETRIGLTAHPDNEDIIVINPGGYKFKPLYLIIGLDSPKNLARKARLGRLSGRDILALRLCYDDPKTCVFTILKNTPHCEVTLPGPGKAPVFFVTEPNRLKMASIVLPGYGFSM